MEGAINTKFKETPIWKCVALFAGCYLGLTFVAGIIVSIFKVSSGGMSSGVLMGSIIFVGDFFVRKNNRLWDTMEKWILIFGLLLATLGIDLLIALFSLPSVSSLGLTFTLAFVGILRLLTLWVFLGPMAKRFFGKRIAART